MKAVLIAVAVLVAIMTIMVVFDKHNEQGVDDIATNFVMQSSTSNQFN